MALTRYCHRVPPLYTQRPHRGGRRGVFNTQQQYTWGVESDMLQTELLQLLANPVQTLQPQHGCRRPARGRICHCRWRCRRRDAEQQQQQQRGAEGPCAARCEACAVDAERGGFRAPPRLAISGAADAEPAPRAEAVGHEMGAKAAVKHTTV